jgi:hypothetical protein
VKNLESRSSLNLFRNYTNAEMPVMRSPITSL